ncbi:SPX domain-containing protein 1 isoform X1 [Neltuma alba]|uniref:SPX domain-containing protein 1 isoform X1 n=2 Tax=Neltuma alba TaxID=207710 RepID=UPI0010A4D559|nr:SPX domain-containing protein 1-like isoform X1 [Prosopis alba]
MKFGKSLNNQIEKTLPEWGDKFLSYKELKKKLKLLEPPKSSVDDRLSKRPRLDDGAASGESSPEEIDFRNLLEGELDKFNTFFVEKEEECIIRLKELQDRVAKGKNSKEEMMKIRKEIVDFHGEMVLLENYSALNYTGLVKILKKYDKRTGALIRLPFIRKVLQQPFFTTEMLYKLIKECETMLDGLFPVNDTPASVDAASQADGCDLSTTTSTSFKSGDCLLVPKEPAEIVNKESLYMKSTISALHVLQEIRSGSSTINMFSLSPLPISGLGETWKKVSVLEQVAK